MCSNIFHDCFKRLFSYLDMQNKACIAQCSGRHFYGYVGFSEGCQMF